MGFEEEFKRIFSNSCSISGYDWNADRPFDASSECYAKEVALVSSLTSEAYGKYGMTVEYYVKNISTQRDKLLGEDPLENIVRRFKLDVYTDKVPELSKSYQIRGMVYTEMLSVQCTIQHFFEASQLDIEGNDIYEPIEPLIGDLIYLAWLDKYYEIIHVRKFSDNSSFLTAPITYEFTLRMWQNSHEDVDIFNENPDDMDRIRAYTSLGEAFDVAHQQATVKAYREEGEDAIEALKNGEPVKDIKTVKSGDILAVNNDLNGQDKTEERKSVNEPIYKQSKISEEIFDPFGDW